MANPTHFAKPLGKAAFEVLEYVKPQSLDSPSNVEVMNRAIEWLEKAIDSVAKSIKELQTLSELKPDEKLQSKINALYSIPNEIVMRVYFALDLREKQQDKGKGSVSDEQRRAFYFKVKPLLKQILDISSDKKNSMMAAHTAHHFMHLFNIIFKYDPKSVLHMASQVVESGEPTGYNLDHISVRETIKLVEAILAQHYDEVQDDDSMHDLLKILDIFVEVGWPEALKLFWRLDELFR